MPEPHPVTMPMRISDARNQFSQLVNQVYRGETRVLVDKSGIPVAAIVSPADLKELERLETMRSAAFDSFSKIGEAFRDESPDDIEREVSQALVEVRADIRAEHQARAAHQSE